MTAHVAAPRAGWYDVQLDKPAIAGQALVVSDNYFPGWHATSSGKALPVARTNYNLIGVPLPAGASSIQLRFEDAAYEEGKVVTAMALLLAVLLWIGGAVVERQAPAPRHTADAVALPGMDQKSSRALAT